MSIYSDVLDLEKMISDSFDKETGEIIEEDVEAGEELREEILSQGIEKLCKVRANLLNDMDGLKAEKERISERLDLKKKEIERLENYILMIHHQSGNKTTVAGTFTVGTRRSVQTIIEDDFNNENYQTIEEVKKIDKKAIKEALQSGLEVEGAYLLEKINLTVK